MSKPWTPSLLVITATANLDAARPFLDSWQATASFDWPLIVVENGGRTEARVDGKLVIVDRHDAFMGSVPAFARAIDIACEKALQPKVIAAFHDDMAILDAGQGWDGLLLSAFASRKTLGLAGFSGASGLGADDIYQTPYSPMQLARQGFVSNMRDAEMHGRRGESVERVACCDGFSLVGRASWWMYGTGAVNKQPRPWHAMAEAGLKHHAYDSAMGAWAARAGYGVEFLPVACHHAGGRTAVANAGYAEWARPQGGDGGFWEAAHKWTYEEFRDQLPIRVERRG